MTQSIQPLSAKLSRSSVETDPIADELRRYDDHLRNVRGRAAGTRHDRCRIVAQLLRKKFAGGVANMAKLRPVDVRRFIARQLEESHSHSVASQLASALRSYLLWDALIMCSSNSAHAAPDGRLAHNTSRGST